MNKIKVIDLLNMISEGEKIPNSFIYDDLIFKRHNDCGIAYYKDIDGDTFVDSICGDLSNLNDEVEIIEEEKKIPEKLSTWFSVETEQNKELNIEYANTNFENMYEKINEIIDYLKSKGK